MPIRSERSPDVVIGFALGASFLALYLITLCPTVYWYDSAEYATAGYVLGIPHPPGYPLYTLIAHLFTYLPLEPATAVNAMSAVFAAVSVGLTYGLVRELGAGRVGAAVGAATLGASRLFWSQALIAEVYTPAIAALAAVTWLVVRGRRLGRPRLILAGALLAGLSLGLHLFIATCGLGLAFLVASYRCDRLGEVFSGHHLGPRFRLAIAALAATAVGSLIYLYLPVRARMGPMLNFGDPSTWEAFLWHITGGNYAGWFGGIDRLARGALIAELFYDQLLIVGIALAAAGALACARRNTILAAAITGMAAGNLYYFFDYRVHDVEVFFLPSIAVTCWLVGMGADHVLVAIAGRVRVEHRARFKRLGALALGLFPLLLVPANCGVVDLSGYRGAEAFGDELVRGLPVGAVIINFTSPPEWKADAVFGSYYQKVKGARPDVRVVPPLPYRQVTELLRRGTSVYLYHPVSLMVQRFDVLPDGPLYRVKARAGALR